MMAPTIGGALGFMSGSKVAQFAADNGWGGWEYALRLVIMIDDSSKFSKILALKRDHYETDTSTFNYFADTIFVLRPKKLTSRGSGN